jgi:hypothetical protein
VWRKLTGHPRLDDESVLEEHVGVPQGLKCSVVRDGRFFLLPAVLERFLTHPATMTMAADFRDKEDVAASGADAPRLLENKAGYACLLCVCPLPK